MSRLRHVVLDRDGVLDVEPPGAWLDRWDDWRWEAGAIDGVRALAAAGVRVSIVTNQSGIGRGVVLQRSVDAVHDRLADELRAMGVDLVGIYCCPHAPADACACRKPASQLVEEAVAASGVGAEATALVGDRASDLDAAQGAGIRAVLVRTGHGREVEATRDHLAVADDLADAVAGLLTAGDRWPGW